MKGLEDYWHVRHVQKAFCLIPGWNEGSQDFTRAEIHRDPTSLCLLDRGAMRRSVPGARSFAVGAGLARVASARCAARR